MRINHNIRFSLYPWLCIITLLLVFQNSTATAEDFPRYRAIEKNVQFWQKIYSTYSLNQAVIHDSKDLSKIYEVVELLKQPTETAAKLNAEAEKRAIKKYQILLKKLSQQRPVTEEEKRIAALFTGNYRSREMGRAAERVRSQSGQKERFIEGVIRSGKYLSEIKRIFASNHLPEDLAYLPHVESSFNTKAYSKIGAAGIWQFTRSTGKRYLQIDYSVDERLDPIRASHAAAKYLKNSYRYLADWPLAITSYNYGLPGMIRAREELGSYDNIFLNYDKGHFKFASKNFYAEFLAARDVAKDLEKRLQIEAPENVSYLKLEGYAELSTLSRHFKLPSQAIQTLNPALRPPVISGETHIPRGYEIRLPKTNQVQKLISKVPSSLYQQNQKATQFHRVQSGETAGSIAQHYKISLKSLMKTNNLDEFATIFIKQRLHIPVTPTIYSNKSKKDYSKMENSSVIPTLVADKKNKPVAQKANLLPVKDPNVYSVFNIPRKNGINFGYITVQPEESLGLYADLLKIKPTELLQLNKLTSETSVAPGLQLLLQFDRLSPAIFEEKRLDFLQETEDDFFAAFSVVGQKSYTVNAGDTLWDLCYNKFEIPLWLLERYNSAINLSRLNRNQELIIPIVQQI